MASAGGYELIRKAVLDREGMGNILNWEKSTFENQARIACDILAAWNSRNDRICVLMKINGTNKSVKLLSALLAARQDRPVA